ncbi:MAG: methyltransferase domain-containing protein [Armatimonadetes bacterium]|nr:methyltransferase domain-containing protein [Armatimonadota bacterium]
MKDTLGKALMRWRVRAVLPEVRGRLLDIGCGTNALVHAYSGPGTGVDVFAWEGCDLVVEVTAHLPYDDTSFDTVTIVAALNHIPNRLEVLQEAHRLLQPEGRLVITMIPPGLSRVWHRLRRPWDADQSERGVKEGEVWGLNLAQTAKLLGQAGFQVAFRRRFMLGVNTLTVAVPQPAEGSPRPA